jgi:hypothetical protein
VSDEAGGDKNDYCKICTVNIGVAGKEFHEACPPAAPVCRQTVLLRYYTR